jgi:hypothetical protein
VGRGVGGNVARYVDIEPRRGNLETEVNQNLNNVTPAYSMDENQEVEMLHDSIVPASK